jgi:hypothetical protein
MNAKMHRNVILLDPTKICVLGGKVEAWARWTYEARLRHRLGFVFASCEFILFMVVVVWKLQLHLLSI